MYRQTARAIWAGNTIADAVEALLHEQRRGDDKADGAPSDDLPGAVDLVVLGVFADLAAAGHLRQQFRRKVQRRLQHDPLAMLVAFAHVLRHAGELLGAFGDASDSVYDVVDNDTDLIEMHRDMCDVEVCFNSLGSWFTSIDISAEFESVPMSLKDKLLSPCAVDMATPAIRCVLQTLSEQSGLTIEDCLLALTYHLKAERLMTGQLRTPTLRRRP